MFLCYGVLRQTICVIQYDIIFKEPIYFDSLLIQKRTTHPDHISRDYNNICLVLNDNKETELCTNAEYDNTNTYGTGFNRNVHLAYNEQYVNWIQPTKNVIKISLYFKSGKAAQIADLKIFYISG